MKTTRKNSGKNSIRNRFKSAAAGAVIGLSALISAAGSAEAYPMDMTSVGLHYKGSSAPSYQVYLRHDTDSNLGDDLYDVALSDSTPPSSPGWLIYITNPAHSAVNLTIDSRPSTGPEVLFNLAADHLGFFDDVAVLKFSQIYGDQDYQFESPVFGSGYVNDVIANNGGYVEAPYQSSMGAFSVNLRPVPEPSSLSLMILGAGAAAAKSLKRKFGKKGK